MFTVTGEIEIPMEEFEKLLYQYFPINTKLIDGGCVRFGKPTFKYDGSIVSVDFAAASDSDPLEWTEPPWFLSHLKKQ